MQSAGENYARIWMCPWEFGIEATANSRTNYRLRPAWQLDYVLQLAEQRGIYLLLCLDYHGMFATQPDSWGGNNYWPQNPYNVDQRRPLRGGQRLLHQLDGAQVLSETAAVPHCPLRLQPEPAGLGIFQ